MMSTRGPQFNGTFPQEEGVRVNTLPGGRHYRFAHLAYRYT